MGGGILFTCYERFTNGQLSSLFQVKAHGCGVIQVKQQVGINAGLCHGSRHGGQLCGNLHCGAITSGQFNIYKDRYASVYGMHQYSFTTYVNGVGPFDANVAYKNYPELVKAYGFNGYDGSGNHFGSAKSLYMGEDFMAYIRNSATGKYITDVNNNLELAEGQFGTGRDDFYSSGTQLFHFYRNDDGTDTTIGQVSVTVGSGYISGTTKYSFSNSKFVYLYDDGYRYFFNVDSKVYWVQLGDNYYRGGRRNLDGYRMYYNPEMLEDLFDAEAIFDPARPTPVPPI